MLDGNVHDSDVLSGHTVTVQVHLGPSAGSCLCPNNITYVCQVNLTNSLIWSNNKLMNDLIYQSLDKVGHLRYEEERVTANLTSKVANEELLNLTSTLKVHDFELNNTKLTCNGSLATASGGIQDSINATATICIIGNLALCRK